ncbi:MAG: sigma factor-like helix-turn-helix DNA-binding protein [Rhodococcus sp. (in: high G+C Gram-positive bacteria)]|uniref:sigma factor-like helix-turn-helix DNA-binding protein n=1 Tax=Rhodococcus sp. TaxID=1831 RepID=UPI003BAE2744
MSVVDEQLHSAALAAAAGDREAVKAAVEVLWPRVVRYCRARSAESVAHDACLAVARELPRLARREHPMQEIYRVIRRVVAQAGYITAAATEGPLQSLEPIAREIVTLRVIDGLSVPDTAGVLGLPVGRVLVVQHRALRRLHA